MNIDARVGVPPSRHDASAAHGEDAPLSNTRARTTFKILARASYLVSSARRRRQKVLVPLRPTTRESMKMDFRMGAMPVPWFLSARQRRRSRDRHGMTPYARPSLPVATTPQRPYTKTRGPRKPTRRGRRRFMLPRGLRTQTPGACRLFLPKPPFFSIQRSSDGHTEIGNDGCRGTSGPYRTPCSRDVAAIAATFVTRRRVVWRALCCCVVHNLAGALWKPLISLV